MGVIGHCFRHYADFSGRAKRSEFWYFILFYVLTVIGLTFIIGAGISASRDRYYGGPVESTTIALIFFLVSLPLIIPRLAVSVRRLHDRNMSGALAIIPFICSILAVIFRLIGAGPLAAICQLATPVLGLILLIVCAFPGTEGPNRYGPDPCNRQVSQGYDFQDIVV